MFWLIWCEVFVPVEQELKRNLASFVFASSWWRYSCLKISNLEVLSVPKIKFLSELMGYSFRIWANGPTDCISRACVKRNVHESQSRGGRCYINRQIEFESWISRSRLASKGIHGASPLLSPFCSRMPSAAPRSKQVIRPISLRTFDRFVPSLRSDFTIFPPTQTWSSML